MAHQEWRENNVAATLALLDSTRADLRGWEWRYVHRLCHSDLLTLKGHTGTVTSASFSPDGSRIVTGSRDETAKVWDAKSGAEVLTLKGHTERCHFGVVQPGRLADRHRRELGPDGEGLGRQEWCRGPHAQGAHRRRSLSASFSPDGSRIVTGSQDQTAKVWDAKSGAEVLTLKGHTGWSDRRRSARTARGSSPGVRTRRRRSGTPRVVPRSSPSRGTPTGQFGVVQPGRLADRHRE